MIGVDTAVDTLDAWLESPTLVVLLWSADRDFSRYPRLRLSIPSPRRER